MNLRSGKAKLIDRKNWTQIVAIQIIDDLFPQTVQVPIVVPPKSLFSAIESFEDSILMDRIVFEFHYRESDDIGVYKEKYDWGS